MTVRTIVHTHSEYSDVLELFLASLFIHQYPRDRILFLTDKLQMMLPYDCSQQCYLKETSYSSRLRHALGRIPEEKVLLLHEDFILFKKPDYKTVFDTIPKIMDQLPNIDFVRLLRSGDPDHPDPYSDLLQKSTNNFAIQATIFRKEFLIKYLDKYPNHSIWDLEKEGPNNTWVQGTYAWQPLCQRGSAHWDSKIFPYMATAVVKGKWNHEYRRELLNLRSDEDFFNIRGWTK